MLNYELAQIFYAIADFLDIEGVAWKPLAYKKAARVLENLREDVEVIYDKKGIKGLMEIEGLGEALPIARKLVEDLKQIKEVWQVEIAGSLRRRKETIGDIDILVSSKAPNKVMNSFTSLGYVDRILAKGETKSSVFLSAGIQADLRVINPAVFGAALQYFTGSKEHNIKLRSIAHNKGYKLSEYGLFNNKTGKLIAGKTEAEIYKKLGRSYIAPELRENLNEIELAKENKLPKLVELKDIKGDFHMHTIASDGVNSAEEMVIAAKKFGYKYIAITDHTKYDRIANGLKEDEMLEYAKRIKELNKKIKGIKIFVGAEVAILLFFY